SGLFRIDEKNAFTNNNNSIRPDLNRESQSDGPWIIPPGTNTAASYTWAQTSGSYTSVSGITLGTVSNDDNTFINIPIGFTFNYDGTNYTTVDVNANGYIKFETISGSNYPYILSLQTNIFAGFNNDLRANNTTSTLIYTTTGAVGSRIMTIQWSNYGLYNAGYDGSDFSFQMKLYESANTVQIVFGPNPTVLNVPAYLIQCGINTTTADYNNRTTTTDWTATTAGASNTAANTFTAAIKPPSGQIWTWTPIAMTFTTSNTIQVTPGVPVYPSTNNNAIIQIPIVTGGGPGNSFIISSFSLGTNGSTNPATDISNAKIYYTGTSALFSTTNLFGTQASPNGTFSILGTQTLGPGTNYFWLAYDVPGGASIGNVLDAQCNSITGSGAMGTVVPTTVAPAGNRPIAPLPPSLCGVKNIPGDYASLAACFADLNISGVTCPTTVNIAPGYTESNVNLVLTCTTNPPNSVNTLTFKKGSAGVNPLLTAGVGTSTTSDGIIILNGVNYVTFDGIDLQENPSNPDPVTQMEWGYAILKQSGTQGSKNISIKNCTVTLNKANLNSVGIYSNNHTFASTTQLTVTSVAGTNSNNLFQNVTVTNSYAGFFINGYNDLTVPYTFYDQSNTIDGCTVTNFGGGINQVNAIYTIFQNKSLINNNIVNGGTGSTGTFYGIF